MQKTYIGLDPGDEGAMTIMYESGCESFSFQDYDIQSIYHKLKEVTETDCCYAVVEDVHSIFRASSKSTFNFGFNKGWIVGLLTAMRIPYSMIAPKEWQRCVWERCDKVMDGKKVKTKETSIKCAKRIFPNIELRRSARCTKPDDGICDSLLMAEYARRNNF